MTSMGQQLQRLTKLGGGTERVCIGDDSLEALASWLAARHQGQLDLIFCDADTWRAAGEAVHAGLRSAGRIAQHAILEPVRGHERVVCEDGVVAATRTFLAASDRINPIAVGSGTVNDIVKLASCQVERPYQLVPTAATMNGYTSSIAAVWSDGQKKVAPAHQPEAVFADPRVITAAPPELAAAGFGDLVSKPVGHADWLLRHMMRGEPYDDGPFELVTPAIDRLMRDANLVAARDPEAMRRLLEALLLVGYAISRGGPEAPTSGTEHVISHWWDTERLSLGRPLRALHGTQVGIATLISARIYDRLLELEELPNDDDEFLAWPTVKERLAEVLVDPEDLARALREAGCPDRPSAIGVEREGLVRALMACRHTTDRYLPLDLLGDLGLLESWARAVAHDMEDDG